MKCPGLVESSSFGLGIRFAEPTGQSPRRGNSKSAQGTAPASLTSQIAALGDGSSPNSGRVGRLAMGQRITEAEFTGGPISASASRRPVGLRGSRPTCPPRSGSQADTDARGTRVRFGLGYPRAAPFGAKRKPRRSVHFGPAQPTQNLDGPFVFARVTFLTKSL